MNTNPRPITAKQSGRWARAQRSVQLQVLVALALMTTLSMQLRASFDTATTRVKHDVEKGEVSSTTVMIAVLVGIAITVGGVIRSKVVNKANGISFSTD